MRRIYSYALLAFATAIGAGADVLVTTDGSVIRTEGPWQQKGKMVVFTLAGGQLSALRAEDVDFEATQRRNAVPVPGEASAASPEPVRPAAKVVITDADVAHVAPSSIEAEGPGAGAAGDAAAPADGTSGAAAEATATSRVRVIAWDQEDPADGDGRVIFGTLRNDGNTFASDVSLKIDVYADEGALMGSQSITPVKTALRPGESTTFRAQFRGVFSVGATRMTVTSLELEVGAAQDAPVKGSDG